MMKRMMNQAFRLGKELIKGKMCSPKRVYHARKTNDLVLFSFIVMWIYRAYYLQFYTIILLEACLLDLLHHHRATADVYKAHCRRCARENHGKETSFRSPEGVWAVFSAASLVSSHVQACFSCRFFGHRVAYALVLLNWLITDLYCFCIWPCTQNDQ